MNEIISKLGYLFPLLILICGCAVYPATHIYFEPSAIDGELYDSTPCNHLSEEYDQIKREFNTALISISAHYHKKNKLKLSVIIEPRENKLKFNSDLFTIVDNVSGNQYLPINQDIDSREVTVAKSAFDSEQVFRHWITLTYDVMSDTLSDFMLVFPEGALELDSNTMDISPIHFIRKEVDTIGYSSINC